MWNFFRPPALAGIGAVLFIALLPGLARADDQVALLRSEIEALKSDYASRVAALESRINQLEAQAVASANVPVEPPAPPPPSRPSSASAFNPAISVILSGLYTDTSRDPSTYHIAGFFPTGGESGPGDRSFNLGESELTLAANVDPYFFANLTVAIDGENEIGVEEAYFRTLALPSGFSIKGGRFFSGIGYLNEIHAHAWDFIDQPLAYQAFLGGQYAEDGLQFKWVAPLDTFLEFGAETGNGSAYPGTRRSANGPNGGALFMHVGHDIGDSASWRAGVSWLRLDAEDRAYEDLDENGVSVNNAFTGVSRTWIADATFKWSPNGNATQRFLKIQGEYLRRTESGDLAFDTEGRDLIGSYDGRSSGWYVQSVYQFLPRWRVGARYDSLDSGTTRLGVIDQGVLTGDSFPLLASASPKRTTVMLDWNPSEFTRIRMQYAYDEARAAEADRQLFLQYLYSIGAHGAHKF